MRGSSPPLVKQSLRLVAVKDDEGRIRMKPQGSLDDPPNKSDMENRVEESKKEWTRNGPGGEGSTGNRNVRTGCNTASDATAMRGITMKDGGRVGGKGWGWATVEHTPKATSWNGHAPAAISRQSLARSGPSLGRGA